MYKAKRVCVIGAGPSGMSALYQFKQLEMKGQEIPEIVCFEKQSDWGGLWNYSWRTGRRLFCCTCINVRGGSRIFFRRRCPRLLLYSNTNKPHSFFFQNTRIPPAPPPRSAPECREFSRPLSCLYQGKQIQGKSFLLL